MTFLSSRRQPFQDPGTLFFITYSFLAPQTFPANPVLCLDALPTDVGKDFCVNLHWNLHHSSPSVSGHTWKSLAQPRNVLTFIIKNNFMYSVRKYIEKCFEILRHIVSYLASTILCWKINILCAFMWVVGDTPPPQAIGNPFGAVSRPFILKWNVWYGQSFIAAANFLWNSEREINKEALRIITGNLQVRSKQSNWRFIWGSRLVLVAVTRGVEFRFPSRCNSLHDIYYERDCNASGCIYSACGSAQSFAIVCFWSLSVVQIFIFICSVSA